jgi:hypothetical protein
VAFRFVTFLFNTFDTSSMNNRSKLHFALTEPN